MKRYLLAALIFLLTMSGCTPLTARTKVHYVSPDGRVADYDSDRDYQDMKLRYVLDPDTGKVKEFELTVGGAGSPAGLAAAALQQNIKLMELVDKLTAGAKSGALSGS